MIRFLSVYPPAPILKQQFSFIHIRWPGLKAKKKPALRAVTADEARFRICLAAMS